MKITDYRSPCCKDCTEFDNFNCENCKYDLLERLLVKIISENDGCRYCEYCKDLGGGYYDCQNGYLNTECTREHNHSKMQVNLDKLLRDYEV